MVGMRWGLLVALSGCNQIFGLQETKLIDAAGAGVDAPFECPPIGMTPKYTGTLQLWLNRNCNGYTISERGRAAAYCRDSGYAELGAVGDALSVAPGLPRYGDNDMLWDQARLAPENDEIMFRRDLAVANPPPDAVQIWIYREVAGTWTHTSTFPVTGQYNLSVSTTSRGPDRRLMMLEDAAKALRELGNTGAGWVDLQRVYSLADLGGFDSIYGAMLSYDGRRMTFWGVKQGPGTGFYYTDRSSLADRFRVATLLEGLPADTNSDLYMTDDCGRAYVSRGNAMYYAQQLPP
jgi:hypothetical protein